MVLKWNNGQKKGTKYSEGVRPHPAHPHSSFRYATRDSYVTEMLQNSCSENIRTFSRNY